jgi:hypothetical protein
MNILVACEYSNIVSQAFRDKGHFVVSADLDTNDILYDFHIVGDCLQVIKQFHFDMLIAFPPCTYLAKVQAMRIKNNPERELKQLSAANFFYKLWKSPIEKICIENPAGYMNTHFKPPSQILTPWYFGDPYQKEICFWLKNLPPLISTCYNTKRKSTSNHVNSRMSQKQKCKIKSKFFPLMAAAMANQWS